MFPYRVEREQYAHRCAQKRERIEALAYRENSALEQIRSGKLEPNELRLLQAQCANWEKEIDQGINELDAMRNEELNLQQKSHDAMSNRIAPAGDMLRRSLIAIRSELGFPADQQWVSRYLEARRKAASQFQVVT